MKERISYKLPPVVTLGGYMALLLVSFQVIQHLPHPADDLGWVLASIGYAVLAGLIAGLWWYISAKLICRHK